MKGWDTISIGNVCELFTDGNWIESKDQSSDGIRLVQTGNVGIGEFKDRREKARWISHETFDRLKCQEVIPGDCLVSRLPDPVGRTCIIPETGDKMITAVDCSILRFDRSILMPDFFKYFTQSREYLADIESKCTGATRKRISRKNLGTIPIPLPPLPEQKRIVTILDEVFAGITQAVVNAEKNLANVCELWAGVLTLACSGELTKGWRQENSESESAKDMLLRAIARRHDMRGNVSRRKEPQPPIVATEIAIPDTWVWASPEQLSTHIVDCPHSTPKWADEGLVCIRTTNFKAGYLDLSSVRYVSEATYTERIKRLEPKPGDVLYSREGGILGIACTFSDGLKACLGQRMMLFRLDNNAVYPRYFACVLNSPFILMIVNRLTAGAAAPHLNIRDIRTFPIPIPPFSEQQQIVTILDTAWKLIQHLETIYQKKLTNLAELKQSILQKAFAGELTSDVANQQLVN